MKIVNARHLAGVRLAGMGEAIKVDCFCLM
jgi:hypothetical protein